MCDFTEKETEAMELESEPRVRAQKLIISPNPSQHIPSEDLSND